MKRILKEMARRADIQRSGVAAARMYLERHTLAAMGQRRRRAGGRILCYHTIGEPRHGVNDVTPVQFRGHIELALAKGYRFVYASEIARTGGGGKDLAITFDDGAASLLTQAGPILKGYGIPWSFFAVSEWCEYQQESRSGTTLNWRQVEELVAGGAELGSHSATHPDFGKIEPERLEEELAGSRQMIERRVGVAPVSFAIPLGQSANWTPAAGEAARAAGYEIVYAQAEETRPPGTIARTFVTRFDGDRIFSALLAGAFDTWEEWY
jgi:peptidoglycan/xylan/chitin deacetylase (PgdA/CDA1 family)